MYLRKIVTTLIILKLKMKTTIVIHDVYCDVPYPEYLHVCNRYYKNPTSFKGFKIIRI
jgi:hypothetical protein